MGLACPHTTTGRTGIECWCCNTLVLSRVTLVHVAVLLMMTLIRFVATVAKEASIRLERD